MIDEWDNEIEFHRELTYADFEIKFYFIIYKINWKKWKISEPKVLKFDGSRRGELRFKDCGTLFFGYLFSPYL